MNGVSRPRHVQERHRPRWAVFGLGAIAVLAMGFFVGYFARATTSHAETIPTLERVSISRCVSERIALLKPEKLEAQALEDAAGACHRLLYNELLINDFTLRRTKFLEQSRDGHVLLWVVVAITISGVALAALQLAASYQLAYSGAGDATPTSDLTLEKNRISLKSSVTGLFILLFSFAFFALFVSEVYTIKELRVGTDPQAPAPSTAAVTQISSESVMPVIAARAQTPRPRQGTTCVAQTAASGSTQ